MKVMTDFFYGAEYADNQDESLAKVQRLVFLNGAESDYLAHHYLLGRLAQQTNVQPGKKKQNDSISQSSNLGVNGSKKKTVVKESDV